MTPNDRKEMRIEPQTKQYKKTFISVNAFGSVEVSNSVCGLGKKGHFYTYLITFQFDLKQNFKCFSTH